MITILSPAKKLLNFKQLYDGKTTEPQLLDQTRLLIEIMKEKTQSQIARLMGLSDQLAKLNYERYQAFQLSSVSEAIACPAIYFFQGDVYQTLEAHHWSEDTMMFSQSHLLILSGLYGLLRPLDLIQPYRLEMGTRLGTPRGKNLYDFWGDRITDAVNKQLSTDSCPILINLASSEYAKVIDFDKINYPNVTVIFKEEKKGQQKVIGIHAKKARGAMARYIMTERIRSVEQITKFNQRGYAYDQSQSNEKVLVFVSIHK